MQRSGEVFIELSFHTTTSYPHTISLTNMSVFSENFSGERVHRRVSWYDIDTKEPITTLTIDPGMGQHAIFKWNFLLTDNNDFPYCVQDRETLQTYLNFYYKLNSITDLNVNHSRDEFWISYVEEGW